MKKIQGMQAGKPDREIVAFEDTAQLEAWLAEHHARTTGIWIHIAKKGSGRRSVTYAEALDCALCYGWIDGQKAKYDEQSWLQYFARRKKSSIWSQVNQKHVERLVAQGRMRAPGLEAIESAKSSGQWDRAYQPTRSREVPEDLERALSENPRAKTFFDSLGSQNRFAFVFRISTAKRAETRLKTLNRCLRMLENGEVFHPKKST